MVPRRRCVSITVGLWGLLHPLDGGINRYYYEERQKRSSAEERLAAVQEELSTLQQDYDRLVNPVEQLECSAAMHEETDVAILREALDVGESGESEE